jgi:two-component system sensor histidine kinase BarA
MSRTTPSARRALVVDDGPMNRALMHGLLAKLGCTVDTAASGEEALQKCATGAYDVAFVDLHMPGLGGRQTVLRLREEERARKGQRVPVVVLTADDAPPDGEQSWFDVFVSKPITLALLEAALNVLTAERQDPVELQPTAYPQEPVAFTAVPQEPVELQPTAVPGDLVDEFLEATAEALAQMWIALAEGHFDSIVRAAHGVKGTGTSFGFARMSALGASLEKDAKARSRERVERGLLELEHSLACA